jgi:hypothetical protein
MQLCRRCGLSEQTIGASSKHAWLGRGQARRPGCDHVAFHADCDNGIIVLVRALLQQPDALLLHCAGELWGPAQQVHLIGVVRAFLA